MKLTKWLVGLLMVMCLMFTAGCSDDEKDDDNGGGWKGPNWPSEFLFKENAITKNKIGEFGDKTTGQVNFGAAHYVELFDEWKAPTFRFGILGFTGSLETHFELVSVEGKTIKVRALAAGSPTIILCTDYTIGADGSLTLTGGNPEDFPDAVLERDSPRAIAEKVFGKPLPKIN